MYGVEGKERCLFIPKARAGFRPLKGHPRLVVGRKARKRLPFAIRGVMGGGT